MHLVFDMHQQHHNTQPPESSIQQAIELHLLSDGHFSLAEQYNRELARPHQQDVVKQGFFQLHRMIESLGQRDVQPALEWARQESTDSESLQDLVFLLTKCRYIQLLRLAVHRPNDHNTVKHALEYGRMHWNKAVRYREDIRVLCTAALFVNQPHHVLYSRYAHILSSDDESLWKRAQELLRSEFCGRLGIASSSPLYVAAAVGMLALPKIAKLAQVTQSSKTEWSQRNELPVEIPVPEFARFHSVFVCPVSKETATDANPPMRMPCGHVLCQDSILRLGRNGGRFKCPYCPGESTPSQATRVFFQ
jgi:hypothetical protein